MIPSLRYLPYETRLQKLGLWTLENRRVRADLIEVYKIIHGLSSVSFSTVSSSKCQQMTEPEVIR